MNKLEKNINKEILYTVQSHGKSGRYSVCFGVLKEISDRNIVVEKDVKKLRNRHVFLKRENVVVPFEQKNSSLSDVVTNEGEYVYKKTR